MNLSVEDFVNVIKNVLVKNVFIFLNNKNVIMFVEFFL